MTNPEDHPPLLFSTDDSEVLRRISDQMERQMVEANRKLSDEIERHWREYGAIQDKDLLIRLAFASQAFYERCLAIHPARALSDDLANVDRAFDILRTSRIALIDLTGKLQARVTFGADKEDDHAIILSSATREVYTYSCAFSSLVQAYRHLVSGRPSVEDGYNRLKEELLSRTGIIKFFADLRRANNHLHILIASPHFNITNDFSTGTREVTSGIAFNRAQILNNKDWSADSKQYVSQLDDPLDALRLVEEHFNILAEFKRVFPTRTGIRNDPAFRDLHKIRVARETMSHRNSLAIILQVAIPKRLNPYEYLARWFTRRELEMAYALPDNSSEQVDYLISLRDPLGLCPQNLRNSLYKLFGVEGADED